MLEQKKISSKINYDVLKDLNIKPCASPARKAESPKKERPATKLAGRNRRPAQTPLSLSTPLSTLGKRFVQNLVSNSECVQESEGASKVSMVRLPRDAASCLRTLQPLDAGRHSLC
uniref:Uncharacterized protein n=1 Tax=Amphilophus citrinellus TaxID=61819 RepID=A0A3Q0T7G7_AMPCI